MCYVIMRTYKSFMAQFIYDVAEKIDLCCALIHNLNCTL